jgi:hypothetical protein
MAAAIFVLTAALYVRTAAPTLGGAFDSEEFQYVAYTLGIAHATGYPLYLLLGKLFTTLVPIGNVAYRMNLLSALLGAGTAVLVYLNALALTRRQIASVAAAALFATNAAVWRQAGVASVGPLHLLLVAAILYAMILWYEKRAPLWLAAFLFGLGLAHHRTVLLLAPAIGVLILLIDPNILRRPRDMARNLFWLALPLLFYLYLPVFGSSTPSYSNTLQGFVAEISGGDAGGFLRTSMPDVIEGIALVSQYLFDSFGYLGGVLIVVGAIQVWGRSFKRSPFLQPDVPEQVSTLDSRFLLFFGLATLLFTIWGTLYAGEPDRYLVMPFIFLIYWFAIGASAVENLVERVISRNQLGRRQAVSSFIPRSDPSSLRVAIAALIALYVMLPFGDRFRVADWSTFDRVYKQWDEIFTLPIPNGAVLVGNWGQLNAMRYMQRVENRRPDLQFVGTLYDPGPQTEAARNAFADGRAIYLAPGIAQPNGSYRYALLGPLLQVRDQPQMQMPALPFQANKVNSSSVTLVGWGLSTALEPYAPMTRIAPARTARVALYWRAGDAPTDFIVRINLYDPEGRLISQKDEPPIRGLYLPSQWQPGEYVDDIHNFLIPAGSPPGVYQLKMQTLDAETKDPTRDEIALGSPSIERVTNLTRDQVFITRPLDIAVSDRVSLWGVGGLDETRCAGETFGFSLLWYARGDVGEDFAAQFALVDALGKTAADWQRAPIPFYPTREWRKGEVLKAYYDLKLPDNIPTGEWSLTVSAGQGSVLLGRIKVTP